MANSNPSLPSRRDGPSRRRYKKENNKLNKVSKKLRKFKDKDSRGKQTGLHRNKRRIGATGEVPVRERSVSNRTRWNASCHASVSNSI